jgi:hypothetical protein
MFICRLAASLSIALLVVALAPAHAALIGLSSGTNQLYRIDEASGGATPLVTTGNASATGLSFLGGTLYATDIIDIGFQFGRIDLATGAFTAVNNQGGSLNWHGLASNEGAGLLYTIDMDDSNKLKSISPSGVITTIGSGTGIDGRGMAYDDANDVLYASGESGLYTVDPVTGVAALIGFNSIFNAIFLGLDFDEEADVLYAIISQNNGASSSLYTVDVDTGSTTLVGSNPFLIDSLAWISDAALVPEPSGLMLLLSGLTALILTIGVRKA